MLWYLDLKHNFAASSAPGVTDDESLGYSYGSLWYHGGQAYVCLRGKAGDALWSPTSAMGTASINGLGDVLSAQDVRESIEYIEETAGDADAAAVRSKLNALIAALQDSGLMEPAPAP